MTKYNIVGRLDDAAMYALNLKKAIVKLFIKQGLMMRTFNHINSLYESGDSIGLRNMVSVLLKEKKICTVHRQYKYEELIRYCEFLTQIRGSKTFQNTHLGSDLIDTLNLDHELGRAIRERVNQIYKNNGIKT